MRLKATAADLAPCSGPCCTRPKLDPPCHPRQSQPYPLRSSLHHQLTHLSITYLVLRTYYGGRCMWLLGVPTHRLLQVKDLVPAPYLSPLVGSPAMMQSARASSEQINTLEPTSQAQSVPTVIILGDFQKSPPTFSTCRTTRHANPGTLFGAQLSCMNLQRFPSGPCLARTGAEPQ